MTVILKCIVLLNGIVNGIRDERTQIHLRKMTRLTRSIREKKQSSHLGRLQSFASRGYRTTRKSCKATGISKKRLPCDIKLHTIVNSNRSCPPEQLARRTKEGSDDDRNEWNVTLSSRRSSTFLASW